MKWFIVFFLASICAVRIVGAIQTRQKYEAGQRVRINTIVRDIYTDSRFRAFIRVDGLKIVIPADKHVYVGDEVEIFGSLEERSIANGQVYFDLHIDIFKAFSPEISFWRVMNDFRQTSIGLWKNWLPADEGGLGAGILFGGNSAMTTNMRDLFRQVGLTHIVAASGYNLSVISAVIAGIGQKLFGRRKTIYFVTFCNILYLFLAGMVPPIIRAAVMAEFVLIGQFLGRRAGGVWVLYLAVVIMILFRPAYSTDVSFQLSALATLGVLIAGEFRFGKSIFLQELQVGIWATFLTAPILAYYFGQFAWISIFLTLFISLIVPIIMQFGLIITIIGLCFSAIGQILSYLIWPLLKIITVTVQIVARMGIGSIGVNFGLELLVLAYLLEGVFVLWLIKKRF